MFVTTRQSGKIDRSVSAMCSISGRPPNGRSALGDPPIRRLLPPARITPLTRAINATARMITPARRPVPDSPATGLCGRPRISSSRSSDVGITAPARRRTAGRAREVQHGRWRSARRRAAVQDEVEPIAEGADHLVGRARARSAVRVRAGRRDGGADGRDERTGERVAGEPHADGSGPRRERRGQVRAGRQDQASARPASTDPSAGAPGRTPRSRPAPPSRGSRRAQAAACRPAGPWPGTRGPPPSSSSARAPSP